MGAVCGRIYRFVAECRGQDRVRFRPDMEPSQAGPSGGPGPFDGNEAWPQLCLCSRLLKFYKSLLWRAAAVRSMTAPIRNFPGP